MSDDGQAKLGGSGSSVKDRLSVALDQLQVADQ